MLNNLCIRQVCSCSRLEEKSFNLSSLVKSGPACSRPFTHETPSIVSEAQQLQLRLFALLLKVKPAKERHSSYLYAVDRHPDHPMHKPCGGRRSFSAAGHRFIHKAVAASELVLS